MAGMGGDSQPLDWHFLQCFGERTEGEEILEADIVSAVEFNHDGQHLATGDRGGRVVLFERVGQQPPPVDPDKRAPPPRAVAFEYRYSTEFQSHEPEFDYLKSLEIEEKINKVRWCPNAINSTMVLSTNDKTIKLWKAHERKVHYVTNFNMPERNGPNGTTGPPHRLHNLRDVSMLRVPQINRTDTVLTTRCRRVFENAHTYHINSISVNSDQETFLSADDLRIHVWNFNVTNECFNVVDIRPPSMEDLTEVITCAEFHPHHCHTFVYSSSRGSIYMSDMRERAQVERQAVVLENVQQRESTHIFAEIINSISDVKFSRDGRFILSRDYMSVKLWDPRSDRGPVLTMPTHDHLWARLVDLYENDCIFDKFSCCISGDGRHIASGSYNNQFRVFDCVDGSVMALEATRDPMRRHRAQMPLEAAPDPYNDYNLRLLHMAWHPHARVVAVAACNSMYMYCAA